MSNELPGGPSPDSANWLENIQRYILDNAELKGTVHIGGLTITFVNQPESDRAALAPDVIICAGCGKKCKAGDHYCRNCGWLLA